MAYLHTWISYYTYVIQVLFLGNTDDTNVLPLPKLLHGEYDDEAQNGVMVFTDYRENHYELADSDLKRISSQNQIEKVISTLATFHSICTAFEQSHGSSFERIFPFLSTDQGNKKHFMSFEFMVQVKEVFRYGVNTLF